MKNFIRINNLDLDIAGLVTQDMSPFTFKVSLQFRGFGGKYLMDFIKVELSEEQKRFLSTA